MEGLRAGVGGSAAAVRKAGIWVVAAFWAVQFAELSAVALIQGRAFAVHQLPERLTIVAAGMLLSVALVETAARLEGRPFRTRLLATLAAALAACALLMAFAYQVALLRVWGPRHLDVVQFVFVGFAWSWFFLSVAAGLVALSYSAEARARSEQLGRLEVVARDARLAALRYQINPHFLFNALNSVAGLIRAGDAVAGEAMVENLADFLRATLETDPVDDVPLEREIDFQRLYLSIEQARFPHRLVTELDVPGSLAGIAIPALLIQPLVENAVQHAVARSAGLVSVRIAARSIGGWLAVVVEDDGGIPVGAPAGTGTGTGLRNVRERLAARYGAEQSLTAAPRPGGGYRAEVRLPLSRLA